MCDNYSPDYTRRRVLKRRLSFNKILKVLRSGKEVWRANWESGQLIKMVGSNIVLKTPDGKETVSWHVPQKDMFAADWEYWGWE